MELKNLNLATSENIDGEVVPAGSPTKKLGPPMPQRQSKSKPEEPVCAEALTPPSNAIPAIDNKTDHSDVKNPEVRSVKIILLF